MVDFIIWVLGVFGLHIKRKGFSFRINGLPIKNFPVTPAAFEKYVRSDVIGSTSLQAAVIIPGEDHDAFSLLSTPEKLHKAMQSGQQVTINEIYQPLVS